ncbi:MAG: YcxB family protein [Clostridiales bacterium]|jgi:hypothetical protein|nr:YcxB family protein [Clostridiales bacterium]
MPIEFTTQIDYKAYEELYFTSRKIATLIKLIALFYIGLSLLQLVMGFMELSKNTADNTIFLIAIMLSFLYLIFLQPKAMFKRLPKITILPRTYKFYDTNFEIQQQSETVSDYTKMDYSELYKVRETRNTFLLYVGKKHAYLIAKKDLTPEQTTDLRNLLIRVIEPKKLKIVS